MVEYEIEGTAFLVDVNKGLLIEKADPKNLIPFHNMEDKNSHYEMRYVVPEKSMYGAFFRGSMDEVKLVTVPQMTALDPEGMAQRYGIPVTEVTGKTDYELIVTSEAYRKRVQGLQPTVEIEGHIFYVSLFAGYLQSKDDFTTMGIRIKDLDDFEGPGGKAWIPYDPKRHEIAQVNFDELYAIPKDWVVIELPYAHELDPFGFARQSGFDQKDILRAFPMHLH